MASTFLGQYLLQKNAVSEKALKEALAYQDKVNNRIGELAIQEGVLTPELVSQVIAAQRESDETFGDLAVRMGFLKQKQMDDLLFKQKIHSVYLGEALLELGHLSSDQYCCLLDEYIGERKKQKKNIHYLLEGYPENRYLGQMIEALHKAFFRFTGARVFLHQRGEAQGKLDFSSDEALAGYEFRGIIPGKGHIYSVLRGFAKTFILLEEAAAPSPLKSRGPIIQDILDVTNHYLSRFIREDCDRLEASAWHRLPESEVIEQRKNGVYIGFDSQQGSLELFFVFVKDGVSFDDEPDVHLC